MRAFPRPRTLENLFSTGVAKIFLALSNRGRNRGLWRGEACGDWLIHSHNPEIVSTVKTRNGQAGRGRVPEPSRHFLSADLRSPDLAVLRRNLPAFTPLFGASKWSFGLGCRVGSSRKRQHSHRRRASSVGRQERSLFERPVALRRASVPAANIHKLKIHPSTGTLR